MLYIVIDALLVAFSVGSFWYLLPRNGQEHRYVQNSDVGSLVTIGIMTVLTADIALLAAGLLG
jgi:hypothetical protein